MSDKATPCPECGGTGKRHIKGSMDKDWREIDCLACHGTGLAPAEAPATEDWHDYLDDNGKVYRIATQAQPKTDDDTQIAALLAEYEAGYVEALNDNFNGAKAALNDKRAAEAIHRLLTEARVALLTELRMEYEMTDGTLVIPVQDVNARLTSLRDELGRELSQ